MKMPTQCVVRKVVGSSGLDPFGLHCNSCSQSQDYPQGAESLSPCRVWKQRAVFSK